METIAKLIGKHSRAYTQGLLAASQSTYGNQPLIALAASTGGPLVLAKILRAIPANFGIPIVIVQHVDAEFAPGLAEWLSEESGVSVHLVQSNDRPTDHKVHLAATNEHLVLNTTGTLDYVSEPKEYPYRPSVDVFFESLAQRWKGTGVAVLLTGMGKDGAEGLLLLRKKRWMTIAQDKGTSIVYGMPKAAADLNAAEKILADHEIASALIQWSAGFSRH